jgi:glutamate-ammonia-ligase adenylyltransferase
MTVPDSPSRLGVWDELVPRLQAIGFIDGEGRVPPEAAALLLELQRGPDPEAALERLVAVLEASPSLCDVVLADQDAGAGLVVLCGASRALSRSLQVESDWLVDATRPEPIDNRPEVVSASSASELPGAVRAFVRRRLIRIATRDLLEVTAMPEVGRALSDLADAAAAATLIAVEREVGRVLDVAPTPIALIAMGKWGGRELNYASDIDVLFVYRDEGEGSAAYANKVAERFIETLTSVTAEGVAFRVDANLRPEGKAGPLARSLDAYRTYYEQWAETWEYQALIKARPAAGDSALGAEFMDTIESFVYRDTLSPDAIREVRAMKGRVEAEAARRGVADTEIKRGVGGIRDVEFAVQLLQLVHGGFDSGLRRPATLDGLEALSAGGYARPEDAREFSVSYQWLRNLEHRIQLFDLRQTHELPTDHRSRERVAKALGYRDEPSVSALDAFEADLVDHRATVRTIHERLFYRPLLEAFASASPAIDAETAERQLAALGFLDADAARRAFDDLTTGLSRRSNLMQRLLPLMLDWLSASPDPDLGLAQLRLLVTTAPDNATLVAALRDSPAAAERLCSMLGTSRILGQLIDRIPEALGELGDDTAMAFVPDRTTLIDEARDQVMVRTTYDERLGALRRFVRRKILRIAMRDLMGWAHMPEVGSELSDTADAASIAALEAVIAEVSARPEFSNGPTVPVAVIAMGKWGGRELNYASDLDVLFVYRGTGDSAAAYANKVAEGFMEALGAVTPEGVAFRVDADLRPEGKSGTLARSLDAYRTYYEQWAQTWEFQSLIKARFTAGDEALGADFIDIIIPFVYGRPLSPGGIRDVKTMKARVEAERIPPGEDPEFHTKLGPGGMADVEFTVQLLQLMEGAAHPSIRERGTLDAIDAVAGAGFLTDEEADRLAEAYAYCGSIRNRLYLRTGQPRDSFPSDPIELERLGLSLAYGPHPRTTLRENYRRVTRRARRIVQNRFYGAG